MYRPLLASRVRYKVQGFFSFLSYMDGLSPVGLDKLKAWRFVRAGRLDAGREGPDLAQTKR